MPPGGIGRLALRALVRRGHLADIGGAVWVCESCDGDLASHPEHTHGLDESLRPAFSAWPGGPSSPHCIDWLCRGSWAGQVFRSVQWVNAGQQLGPLDSLPLSLVDAVLTVRAEWDTIRAEESKRDHSAH